MLTRLIIADIISSVALPMMHLSPDIDTRWHVSRRQLAPGTEFVLQEAQEPHLFVIKRQYRSNATTVTAHAVYYILEGGASPAHLMTWVCLFSWQAQVEVRVHALRCLRYLQVYIRRQRCMLRCRHGSHAACTVCAPPLAACRRTWTQHSSVRDWRLEAANGPRVAGCHRGLS